MHHHHHVDMITYLIFSRYGTAKKPPKTIRDKNNKWWVPSYLYNKPEYPVIVSGSSYVTTRPASLCLFNRSLELPFFHLEDVFVTGFAAEMCGINRLHSDKFNPRAINFVDLKMTDISWHYLDNNAVLQMHKIFMFNELLSKYQDTRQQLVQLQRHLIVNDCSEDFGNSHNKTTIG